MNDVVRPADGDDATLLRRIADDRDHQAFEEFCSRHSKRAYNVAMHFLRNTALADDALQEALLAVWLSAGSYQPEKGKAGAWLMSIVVKKSLHLARTRRHSARREQGYETSGNREAENIPGSAESAEEREVLNQELARLPEADSQLLVCAYGAGLTHREIAAMLGLSKSTVTEKLQLALNRLRARLKQAGIASAAPLVLEQRLAESLSAGYECPPDVLTNTFIRIESGNVASSGSLTRSAFAKQGKWVLLVLAPVVACAVAVIAWSAYGDSNTTALKGASAWRAPGKEPGYGCVLDLGSLKTLGGTRVGITISAGSEEHWQVTPGASATTLIHTTSDRNKHDALIVGAFQSGSTEWTATIEDPSGMAGGEAGFAALNEAIDLRVFGRHAIGPQKATLRILAWPRAGNQIQIVALRDGAPIERKRGPQPTMGYWGNCLIQTAQGRFNVGFFTNTKAVITDFRVRSLPAEWTPENEPALKFLRESREWEHQN